MMLGLGRYNLLLKLGQGGMGAVYLARQKTLKRYCAVKVISPELARDKDTAERFLREARATASLSHPNLINVFDCDRHEEQYFIAMEYVEGMSLGQILRKVGPLPLPLAFHWLGQSLAGLEYIHAKKIIHRDIKPDNMMIDGSGGLKIMDLGLAKDHVEGDQGMTVTGMVMGSPHYMSPEQINDSKTADHRSDLYALSISFFQMLMGHVPFQHSSAAAICVAHLQEAIPSVALADAEVTAALDQLIAKAAAKDRDARFQSAAEMRQAFEPWLEAFPMDASAQEIFNNVGFQDRTVANLLEKEGISAAEVDLDYDSKAPPAILPTPLPSGSVPPAAVPSFWSGKGRWLAAAAVVALLLAWGIHSLRPAKPDAPALTVAARPSDVANPSPVPVALTQPPPVPPKDGSLFARTTPEKATIILGTETGLSPCTFKDVKPGRYRLRILLSGYRDLEKEVEIREGELTPVNEKLERIPGKIMVESDPPGADLLVNGELKGQTPWPIEGGDGESVECLVRMEGYQEAKLTVELQEKAGVRTVKLAAVPKPVEVAHHADGTPAWGPARGNMEAGASPGGERGVAPGAGGEGKREMFPNMPEEMKDGARHFDEVLGLARNTSDTDWILARKEQLAQMKEGLKARGAREGRELEQMLAENGKILDEARKLSASEFERQETELVMRMMMNTRRAMGKGEGGPPGGGGSGGGVRRR